MKRGKTKAQMRRQPENRLKDSSYEQLQMGDLRGRKGMMKGTHKGDTGGRE